MDIRTRKFINIFTLSAILLLGFGLRIYNVNFPSIGYHSIRENEYLSMAQEMRRTNDFIAKRIYFYNAFEEKPGAKFHPRPPLISYQTLIAWKLFGENLWGARLINIFFGVLAVLAIYFIALLLFRDTLLSLYCALLLGIMPLAVFFSRNLMPESPAFFFMILGSLFYLKFISSFKKYNLFLGGILFSVAWLYEFNFLIGLFPFIFCFPFKSLFKSKNELLKTVAAFFSPYAIIAGVLMWLRHIGCWEFTGWEFAGVKFSQIFTPAYWARYGHAIWWYTKGENFTIVFLLTTLFGVITAFFKRGGLLNRYIIGWALSLIPYAMMCSELIKDASFYQMPYLVLVCVSTTYTILYISESIKEFIKKDIILSLMSLFLMAAILGVSIPFAHASLKRMHGTAFFGMDVAGESLREFTRPGEHIFLYTHVQGKGIARYARRYAGWTEDLEDFKDKEKRFNVRYICFYPAEFAFRLKANNPSLFGYIQNNYHIKEAGLVAEQNSKVYYIILERGKGSDPETFLQSFSGPRELRTIYRVLGKYIFFYSLRPPIEEPQK